MATFDAGVRAPPSLPSALRLAPALYAATLFVSALLLFAVQPMFAKMVLPRLGGAPAVWSVAMVFFQGALLAGYAYAHLLCRLLPPGRAALIHLAVLAAAALTLPIGVAAGFDVPPQSGIAFWLVALFAASIGLPFVALAASAPLLQHWFAASGHAQARNPYVLYAASNLGSFTALLAYPFVFEPLLRLGTQARLWSIAFAALALLVAAAGLMVARRESADVPAADAPSSAASSTPSWPDRLRWMALAAIPSGLVVAVTSFVTTDVAAAPFLWVIPLAMYLATFVAVFRERPWFDHATMARLAPLVVAPVAVTLLGAVKPHWIIAIAYNLLTFAILTLVCHGELYRRRPAATHLTAFYLWISLGGALGGAFAGLIAPYAFNDIYEYPILIAGALLALPGFFAGGRAALLRQAGPFLALAACVPIARMAGIGALSYGADGAAKVAAALVLILIVLRRKRPAEVFGLVVFAFVFTGAWRPTFDHIATVRSFFGVHRVLETTGGAYRVLMHGTTMHGAMRLRGDDGAALTGRPAPLTYYYEGSPIAEAIAATRAAHSLHDVAVVGLGAGSLACYRKNAENWTFYEIDPQVVRIARDPHLFRFLSDCAPSAGIVLGDARLTLAAARTRHDLIVLDAFSSDAIPVHLLTQEAFAIYFAHLTPHGVLVIHTSNRHLDLAPALAAAAKAAGLVAFSKERDQLGELLSTQYKASSSVVVMARKRADLGALPARPGWQPLTPADSVPVWTDDYSDILRAMRWGFGF